MIAFPWGFTQAKSITPRETMLQRLAEGVPLELCLRAARIGTPVHDDPDIDVATAEGEISLFERARDSGVTGAVRAAQRNETKTWVPKADVELGRTLEDYLRD